MKVSAEYAKGDQREYKGLYGMNMRLLPNVIQKVVINMGNGKIAKFQQLDEFEPLNNFRKRRRELKCGGNDPRLGRINELWDKKLTISMRIEDPDFRDIESDEVDCWEFTYKYQQNECTTTSQFEFDKINSRDEVDRKNAIGYHGYRDFLKEEFFDFDFDFFLLTRSG